jgi:hypothetical protein
LISNVVSTNADFNLGESIEIYGLVKLPVASCCEHVYVIYTSAS